VLLYASTEAERWRAEGPNVFINSSDVAVLGAGYRSSFASVRAVTSNA
jgi:hypothetical protein